MLSVLGMSLTFPYKEEPTIENVHGFIEEENDSNEHVDFNTKVGLKARLYNIIFIR